MNERYIIDQLHVGVRCLAQIFWHSSFVMATSIWVIVTSICVKKFSVLKSNNKVQWTFWNCKQLKPSTGDNRLYSSNCVRKFLLWLCKVVIISITNSMYRHSCHCTTYILLKVHNLKLLHIITHDFEVGIDSILEFSMDWKLDKNQILPLSVSNLFLLNYP